MINYPFEYNSVASFTCWITNRIMSFIANVFLLVHSWCLACRPILNLNQGRSPSRFMVIKLDWVFVLDESGHVICSNHLIPCISIYFADQVFTIRTLHLLYFLDHSLLIISRPRRISFLLPARGFSDFYSPFLVISRRTHLCISGYARGECICRFSYGYMGLQINFGSERLSRADTTRQKYNSLVFRCL